LVPSGGSVLGPPLEALANDLAELYVNGDLVLVAGAGVSRASGMPGWADMVTTLQAQAARDLASRFNAGDIDVVLARLHTTDPISRADSLQRLLGTPLFRRRLHDALYGGLPPGESFRPSVSHWHLASLADRTLMPDLFTSNFDDLLEDAKLELGRSGRVRHFHGRLPQAWGGSTRLGDPPVVTSRDYMAAEEEKRYEKFASALRDKTVVLVGFSLADPNLARIIRAQARDCRAILVASPTALNPGQQQLRLNLLRRYWRALNISVTAIEAYEELPAFLLALRRRVLAKLGRSLVTEGERALKDAALSNPWTWPGARDWRVALRDAVVAAKAIGQGVRGDRTLRAGFYAVETAGRLVHLIGSTTTMQSYANWPRRRLNADELSPWGAAGYAYAAGVPITSSATGPAFDRNVPEDELIAWQSQRAAQRRLPASSVLCVPAWVKYRRTIVCVGVLYFSSQRAAAFDDSADADELRSVLQLTLGTMIKHENVIEGGPA
jgi:SIR2-like protein